MDEPTEFNLNYADMVVRDKCRFNYRETGELECPVTLTEVEQYAWDDEVQQILNDEAQSV